MEAELPSADVDDRSVTEDAAIAGSVLTPKAMEVFTCNEEGIKVSSVDEEVNQVQGSMGNEEDTALKDVHKSEMEEDLGICEHTENLKESRFPPESKAPHVQLVHTMLQ